MSDEKSQAQQDKESRIEKIEDGLKKEYEKLFKEHQDGAEKAREDQPDTAETEEEYHERISAVTGGKSDPSAFDENYAAKEAAASSNVAPEEAAQIRPVVTNENLDEAAKEGEGNEEETKGDESEVNDDGTVGDPVVTDPANPGVVPGTGEGTLGDEEPKV